MKHDSHEGALHSRTHLDTKIGRGMCDFDRPLQDVSRFLEQACHAKVHPKLGLQIGGQRRRQRNDAGRTPEEGNRSRSIAAFRGPDSGLAQPATRILGKLFRAPIRLAKVDSQVVRSLEVVADEFVELGGLRGRLVETIREALVQLRTQALRRRAVHRVLNDDMAEAESVLGRPEEAASDERLEMRADGGNGTRFEERGNVAVREHPQYDRPALEYGSLAWPKPLETRSQQRLHRLRQRLFGEASFERDSEQLLDEKRVSFRRLGDTRPLIRPEDRAAEPVQESIGVLGRERI